MRYLAATFVFLMAVLARGAVTPTATQVRPHGLFTDNMVLQRGMPIMLYGTASNTGNDVEFVLDKHTSRGKVDAAGCWRAELPAQPAGGPFTLSIAGAAWYQGESNSDRGEQYRTLLPAMIGDWRRGARIPLPDRAASHLWRRHGLGGGARGPGHDRSAGLPRTGLAVIMFANYSADANLGNLEGLPCGTFRTDDWPVESTGKR